MSGNIQYDAMCEEVVKKLNGVQACSMNIHGLVGATTCTTTTPTSCGTFSDCTYSAEHSFSVGKGSIETGVCVTNTGKLYAVWGGAGAAVLGLIIVLVAVAVGRMRAKGRIVHTILTDANLLRPTKMSHNAGIETTTMSKRYK